MPDHTLLRLDGRVESTLVATRSCKLMFHLYYLRSEIPRIKMQMTKFVPLAHDVFIL